MSNARQRHPAHSPSLQGEGLSAVATVGAGDDLRIRTSEISTLLPTGRSCTDNRSRSTLRSIASWFALRHCEHPVHRPKDSPMRKKWPRLPAGRKCGNGAARPRRERGLRPRAWSLRQSASRPTWSRCPQPPTSRHIPAPQGSARTPAATANTSLRWVARRRSNAPASPRRCCRHPPSRINRFPLANEPCSTSGAPTSLRPIAPPLRQASSRSIQFRSRPERYCASPRSGFGGGGQRSELLAYRNLLGGLIRDAHVDRCGNGAVVVERVATVVESAGGIQGSPDTRRCRSHWTTAA